MSFVRVSSEKFDSIPEIPDPAENPLLIEHGEEGDRLAEAYSSGKLHHAIILSGRSGIGKATLAFHVANHLLSWPDASRAPDTLQQPNPQSVVFRQIAQGAHPAVLHLTRPPAERTKGFKTAITVDEVRKVNRFLQMTSHDGAYRVVIIDSSDDMNRNAANALLKNLEEPPHRTLFILIAHSIGRILPTLRSRCQVLKLRPLSDSGIEQVLAALKPSMVADREMLARVIGRANGSVRDALLLTEFGGLDIGEAVDAVVAGKSFDVGAAYRVADAVGGRDNVLQFQLFNQKVLEAASGFASAAAEANLLPLALRCVDAVEDIRGSIVEADTYNLDKKQHVVGLLKKLQSLHREAGQAG